MSDERRQTEIAVRRLLDPPLDSHDAWRREVRELTPEHAVALVGEALRDDGGEPRRRKAAALMLGILASGPAVATLVGALTDPDPRVRGWAVAGLGEAGEAGRSAGGALLRLLADPAPHVRKLSAETLAGLELPAEQREALASGLREMRRHDPEEFNRRAAADLLRRVGGGGDGDS